MILTICILFLGNIGVLPKFGPIDLKRPKICNLEDIPILYMLDNFFVIFLLSVNFFKITFFQKDFHECHHCQTVWFQIYFRTDILSGLI